MAIPTRLPEFSGEPALCQQRREWQVQRAAWCFFLLIMVAALAGFLGDGPASNRTARGSAGRLSVRYERFVRQQSSTTVALTVRYPDNDGAVRLAIGQRSFREFDIRALSPSPASTVSGPDRNVLSFLSTPGAGENHVSLTLYIRAVGAFPIRVELLDSRGLAVDAVDLKYFSYP